MKIRRFEGKDAAEALQLARMALGPDAVILQTRAVKATGFKSLVGRPRVEVMAAVDRSEPPAGRLAKRDDGTAPRSGPASPADPRRRQTPDARRQVRRTFYYGHIF